VVSPLTWTTVEKSGGPRVRGEILARSELFGVDEDRDDDAVAFGPCGSDEGQMTLVQRPHGRHQADSLPGLSPKRDVSSQIGDGPRNVHPTNLNP
jgi:hypothetical protein